MLDRILVICDIDSTVADIEEYLGFLIIKPKNFPAFYNSIPHHKPIQETVDLIEMLGHKPRYDVVFLTARSDECRLQTQQWLDRNFSFPAPLYMRKAGDYRKNFIVKEEILEQIRGTYERIIAFEDDEKCVKMFRSKGVHTFDVGVREFL
jgi:hypothetical protein